MASAANVTKVLKAVRRRGLGGDIVLLAVAAASGLLSPYYVFVMTSVAITAMLCLSVGVTTERAGVISLCQVAMAGVGAWVANWLLVRNPDMGVGLALAASCVIPAVLALLIALPTLRVRGVQLAIVTLAFALAVNIWLTRQGFTGADEGQSYVREGWLEDDTHLFWLCAGAAILASRVLVALEQRPFGAAWFGVKFSERAVAALGVNVPWTKISAFTVGAAVAGLSGGLLVLQLGALSSRNFEPMASLVIFALAILSYSRFMSGALIAALLTWFIPEFLSKVGLAEWKDLGDLLFALGALHALRGRFKGGVAAAPQQAAADTGRLPPGLSGKGGKGVSLILNQITVRYGATVAVSDVSFEIRPGVVTGLVGPNGAGKSSLVDALTGFTRASGEILLDGQSVEKLPAHERARLGLRRTFQVGRAIPELTVGQYLRLAGGKAAAHAAPADMAEMLDWLGCPPLDASIAALDVGTRRLVELGGALLARPKVLLLDEPAAGMSAKESAHLGRVIRQVPEVLGCAVLLIEHDLALIREVCTDLIVLEFGSVIACGPVEATLAQPHVVDAYIGAAA